MKRSVFSGFSILLIIAMSLGFSCSKSARGGEMGAATFAAMDESAPSGSPEMKKDASRGQPAAAPSPSVQASHGRKLVYNADMSLEAEDTALAESAIVSAALKAGGYVASRSSDDYGTYLQIRLPVPALEPIMAVVNGTGRALSRSLSAQDVTDQYFDLEGRLRNKRILEERYRDYLKKAQAIKDMLEVEQKLSETTTEIEFLEGSFRDLSRQIELATLTISIKPLRAADPSRPGFLQSVGNLFASFGRVMGTALVVLLGALIYGIPLILFLALLWLLAFGRVGLLRRLFGLVRDKGKLPR